MPNDRSLIIEEMLIALRANIEFLNSHGSSKTLIKNGIFLKEVVEQYLYEFELDFFQSLEEDCDVEVRITSTNTQGKIYSIDEPTKTIQVLLDTFLGASVSEAYLIITNDFLLKKLCERLDEVASGTKQVGLLAECVLSPMSINNQKLLLENSDFPNFSLNEGQLNAINLALGSTVSYIWGPPGTGKTSTIAPLITNQIASNKSVLLLSHTNIATDRALLQFIKKAHIDFSDPRNLGKYLRLGKISKELEDYKEHIDVNSVAEKKMKPIAEEIERLEILINKNELSVVNAKHLLEIFSDLNKKIVLLGKLEEQILESKQSLETYKAALSTSEKELRQLSGQIDDFQHSNFFRKLLIGTNLQSLMNNKSSILVKHENTKNCILSTENQISIKTNESIKLDSEIKNLNKTTNNSNEDNLKEVVEKNSKETSYLKDQITILRGKLEKIRSLVISESQLIATTLSKSYLDKHVLERQYDCVILDEASMAPIPALYYASGLAKERVVIVGDFCQLPPIAQYSVLGNSKKSQSTLMIEKNLVEKWLKQDIFSYSKTTGAIQAHNEVPWMSQLNEQYRMHPEIMDVVNHLVYGNFGLKYSLQAGSNTLNIGLENLGNEPFPNNPLGIVIPDKKHSFPNRTHSGSYYNIYSALIAIEMAKRAINSGNKRVGIITPFRPQANLIQQMIVDSGLETNVVADTVHRFQGEEKEVIIFDTVTSKPTQLTDNQELGGDDEKILNVALSRAESKCILIADIEGIKKKHSASSFFRKFIEYCENKGLPSVDSSIYVSGVESDLEEEKWLERIYKLDKLSSEMDNGLLADQVSFYKFLFKDLLEAKYEVIIDSPFITRRRAEQFLPIFNNLISKGINIFVITRLPKDQINFMENESIVVLREFEKIGIIVLPFKGLPHRKLAMIDRKVFWNGSLNILSQRESQEMMIRTVGVETCKEVLKFLRFDKNVGKEMGFSRLEHCDQCEEVGSWFWSDIGQFGPWTFCLSNGHKKGKPPISNEDRKAKKVLLRRKRTQVKEVTSDGIPLCPDHNAEMVKKRGRFGEFWGCPHYPRCRVVDKIKNK